MSKENESKKQPEKSEQSAPKTPSQKPGHISESIIIKNHRIGETYSNAEGESSSPLPKPPVDLTTTVGTHNRENKTKDNKD